MELSIDGFGYSNLGYVPDCNFPAKNCPRRLRKLSCDCLVDEHNDSRDNDDNKGRRAEGAERSNKKHCLKRVASEAYMSMSSQFRRSYYGLPGKSITASLKWKNPDGGSSSSEMHKKRRDNKSSKGTAEKQPKNNVVVYAHVLQSYDLGFPHNKGSSNVGSGSIIEKQHHVRPR